MSKKKLLNGFKKESKEINFELKIYINCGMKNRFKGQGIEQEDQLGIILVMIDGGLGQCEWRKRGRFDSYLGVRNDKIW